MYVVISLCECDLVCDGRHVIVHVCTKAEVVLGRGYVCLCVV